MVDKYNSRSAFRGCRAGSNGLDSLLSRQSGGCVGERETVSRCSCGETRVGSSSCSCGNSRQGARQNGCCGSNARNSMNGGNANQNECKKLMEKLKEVEFSLIDTVLYLDVYPHSCEALAYYNKLKEEREEIIKALAMSCNKPMTMFDNYGDTWMWTDAPWPWENCAN